MESVPDTESVPDPLRISAPRTAKVGYDAAVSLHHARGTRPMIRVRRRAELVLAVAVLAAAAGCSLKRMAVNSIAHSLASGGDVFTSDDDPELVRDALPFGLKTIESLLAIVPDNRKLLLAGCQGYTQYSFAFVESDAELVESTDHARATELRERALKLYL